MSQTTSRDSGWGIAAIVAVLTGATVYLFEPKDQALDPHRPMYQFVNTPEELARLQETTEQALAELKAYERRQLSVEPSAPPHRPGSSHRR